MTTLTTREVNLAFPCFGGRAAVLAAGPDAERLAADVRRALERWHSQFSRFDPRSELSLINAAPSARVRASETMRRFVEVSVEAARRTSGLVDPTLVDRIEAIGYTRDIDGELDLRSALELAPPRMPAAPAPAALWRKVHVHRGTRIIERPAGLRLDSGGVAKGLFADLAAETLSRCESFAVDCCGDLRIGSHAGISRIVRVDDPFERGILHEWERTATAAATSGIGRRAWVDAEGRPAHHLLNPATGRPAYTGVVQATALAPTAVDAELRAKAALLSGPTAGREWLRRHGGVLVFDDGSHEVIE
jgi:FAD:protein FMN transferase